MVNFLFFDKNVSRFFSNLKTFAIYCENSKCYQQNIFLQLLKDSGFYIVINKISLTTTNTYYNKFIIY